MRTHICYMTLVEVRGHVTNLFAHDTIPPGPLVYIPLVLYSTFTHPVADNTINFLVVRQWQTN